MARIAALQVADEPEAWRGAGFAVDDDGHCRVGSVRLCIEPDDGARGVRGWFLAEAGEVADVDGIPTAVSPAAPGASPTRHANGVDRIDHLVLSSPNLARTVAALGAIGLEPRRTRAAESNGRAMEQVFFRMGEVVLELVGPPEPAGDGPARFYGLAFTVSDLDATAGMLGERLGRANEAVQPGRRIATLRRHAGLATAVAFMTPDPR